MRFLVILVAAALAGPVFAGCIGAAPSPLQSTAASSGTGSLEDVLDRLSKPLAETVAVIHEIATVPAHDGVEMEVDVWRPDVADRVPVILVASPYNNPLRDPSGGKDPQNGNRVDIPLYHWIERELIPRGYAFAHLDIRGTRDSGGCMGINSPEERRSTAAVVDWLGDQEWSNGKVGMIGKSYLAKSQSGAAIEAPEHLVTMVPISGVSHQYGYHYYNGAQYLDNTQTNPGYMTESSATPPDRPEALHRYPERFPCMPEQILAGLDPSGDYSERWQERDYRPHVGNVKASVLFVHGLQDWNVKPDHVLDWYNGIPTPKMALLGQWGHDYPDNNRWDAEKFGHREDWYYLLHRWLDHWLKGIDTGLLAEIEGSPVQVQGSDAVWRTVSSFPPNEAAEAVLHPTPEGGLMPYAPDAAGVRYADPAPATPAEVLPALPSSPAEPTSLEFTTEALANPIRVSGAPTMRMRVASTTPYTTVLSVALVEETGGERKEISWGYLDLRHRESLELGKDVRPGEAYDVEFRLFPVDHVFAAGSKVGLVVRGFGPFVRPNPTPGVQTLQLGEETSLRLPLLSLGAAFTPLSAKDLPERYQAPK